jgi:hypothetical protein
MCDVTMCVKSSYWSGDSGTQAFRQNWYCSQNKLQEISVRFSTLRRTHVNSSIAIKKRNVRSQLHEKSRRRFRNIKKAEYQIQLLIFPFFFDVEKPADDTQLNRIGQHFNRGLREKQNSKIVHICIIFIRSQIQNFQILERICYQFLRLRTASSSFEHCNGNIYNKYWKTC